MADIIDRITDSTIERHKHERFTREALREEVEQHPKIFEEMKRRAKVNPGWPDRKAYRAYIDRKLGSRLRKNIRLKVKTDDGRTVIQNIREFWALPEKGERGIHIYARITILSSQELEKIEQSYYTRGKEHIAKAKIIRSLRMDLKSKGLSQGDDDLLKEITERLVKAGEI